MSKRRYLFLKRFFDVLFSLLLIFLLLPLMLSLWTITLFDSKGKPIFQQKRLGKNKNIFKIIKFRSMKVASPYLGAEYLTEEKSQKLTTNWGSFLRKTSLDELPQLFNILIGEMSFIGPRPGLTKEGEPELVLERDSYLPSAYTVKPGLSGYAQIVLKKGHNIKERARLDSYYVKHASISLDIKIFLDSVLFFLGLSKRK